MTPEMDPPPRNVPDYATSRSGDLDWDLFGKLSIVLGVGAAAFLAFAFFAAPRLIQILKDFKVELPAITQWTIELVLLVIQGGYLAVIPLPPVVALLAIQLPRRVEDEDGRARWRRWTIRAAVLAVVAMFLLLALAFLSPCIALISAVSGPQKR